MRVKIYGGGLTAADLAGRLSGAELAAPVMRGDLHRDLACGVQVVGLVDGSFLGDAALSPMEIVDCLRVGIRVFGAGGLGAVRAAELHHLGMVGCGRVYESVRADPYLRDDDLGPGSAFADVVPMVDLQVTVGALQTQKRLSPQRGREVLRLFRDLHYSRRTFNRVAELLQRRARAATLLTALALVQRHHVSQQRLDALTMLDSIRDELRRVAISNQTIDK